MTRFTCRKDVDPLAYPAWPSQIDVVGLARASNRHIARAIEGKTQQYDVGLRVRESARHRSESRYESDLHRSYRSA
jgi:hypothetical protein